MLNAKMALSGPAGLQPQRSGFAGSVAPLRAAQRSGSRRQAARAAQASTAGADVMGDPLPSPEKRVRPRDSSSASACEAVAGLQPSRGRRRQQHSRPEA